MTGQKRVGILGGGQLGRMLALAGYQIGVNCLVLDPHGEACASQVTTHLVADYRDERAMRLFTKWSDVATYEFENVPVAAAESVAREVPLYPSVRCLQVTGDRLAERRLLAELGIPCSRWAPVTTPEELDRAGAVLGFPLLLKTCRLGYDGKGQTLVRTPKEAVIGWNSLRQVPCIAEQVVPFERELSLLAVRSTSGEVAFYPLVENVHKDGILRHTMAPAPDLTPELQALAEGHARQLLQTLDYVGVLAIEFFQCGAELLVNELAPRVHNSGHWSLEGAATSQFENHLRAITGMPLGSTAVVARSAMVNLIGRIPPIAAIEKIPGARLHCYGKLAAPGRKLGHITVTADSDSELAAGLARVRSALGTRLVRTGRRARTARSFAETFNQQAEEKV